MKKVIKGIIIALVLMIVGIIIARAVVMRQMENPKAPTVEEGKKHIACIGDSITFGFGVPFTRNIQSYPAYLQVKFDEMSDDYQVLNYGLNNRTLNSTLDLAYQKDAFYQTSLEVAADAYIIMLGANDSKEYNWDANQYKQDLIDMIDAYKNANPMTAIFVVQPSKCFADKNGNVAYDIRNEIVENEIHSIIAEVGDESEVSVIDLYSYTKDHPEWFMDGVHPNAQGNKAIADYIYSCYNAK